MGVRGPGGRRRGQASGCQGLGGPSHLARKMTTPNVVGGKRDGAESACRATDTDLMRHFRGNPANHSTKKVLTKEAEFHFTRYLEKGRELQFLEKEPLKGAEMRKDQKPQWP